MNIDLITAFVPEFKEIFIIRYEILDFLNCEGTTGRRSLSAKMNISERVVRDEVSILKEMNCVDVSSSGISITEEGKNTLKSLAGIYKELNSLTELGRRVAEKLNVKEVIVVKGDCSKSGYANLGKEAAGLIEDSLCNGDILGVTGGRTLSAVADEMEISSKNLDVTVIPARGSLGRSVKFQANSIASKIAVKLGCEYELLPVPDTASKEAMKMLMENSEVKNSYSKLKSLDILVFGIGSANVMLERRSISEEEGKKIIEGNAVGEAFGHYFNIEGKEVYKSQSIGISIDDFLKIKRIIGVAGGSLKAEAIISISTLRDDMTLVIDESAAKEILNIRIN